LRWLARGRVLTVSFVFIPKTTKAGRFLKIINACMVSLLQGPSDSLRFSMTALLSGMQDSD